MLWTDGSPTLAWQRPDAAGDDVVSVLALDAPLAFRVAAGRACTGVWRSGRRLPCPTNAPLPAESTTVRCTGCTAMDRSSSVAADTRLDDPRLFAVYLAHHGDAGVKVGITAAERGTSRLLEQGALASVVIGQGPLATARRTENVLAHALGLPDRMSTRAKRAARRAPGTAAQRTAELSALRDHAHTAAAWPDTLERTESAVLDHAAAYGLPDTGLPDHRVLAPLALAHTLVGSLRHAVGPDVYLDTTAGLVLIDTRLLAGWGLIAADRQEAFTAALREPTPPKEPEPDALF